MKAATALEIVLLATYLRRTSPMSVSRCRGPPFMTNRPKSRKHPPTVATCKIKLKDLRINDIENQCKLKNLVLLVSFLFEYTSHDIKMFKYSFLSF